MVQNVVHCRFWLSVDENPLLLQLLLQILEISQLYIRTVWRRFRRGRGSVLAGRAHRHQGGRDGRDSGGGSGGVLSLGLLQHFNVVFVQDRHWGHPVGGGGYGWRAVALARVSEKKMMIPVRTLSSHLVRSTQELWPPGGVSVITRHCRYVI